MPSSRIHIFVLSAVLLLGSAVYGGEEGLVSTMSLVPAVGEAGGITIVPAADIPAKVYTEDYGPSQVLEIIRPDMGPITVGRLHSSCTCVRVELPKRTFAQGERALLEVRNVKKSPTAGATYAVFVQLSSPIKETLQYDLFIKSDRTPGPASAPAAGQTAAPVQPSAGQIVPAPAPVAPRVSNPSGIRYEEIVPYKPRS